MEQLKINDIVTTKKPTRSQYKGGGIIVQLTPVIIVVFPSERATFHARKLKQESLKIVEVEPRYRRKITSAGYDYRKMVAEMKNV